MPTLPPTFNPQGTPGDRRRQYDARRGSARARGYTPEWDREAVEFKRAHPLCLGCEALGLVVPVHAVDHVEPHAGDQIKFWDRGNWQSACRWHHSQIKQRLELLFAAGKIEAAELWLDSATAVRLALELDPDLALLRSLEAGEGG